MTINGSGFIGSTVVRFGGHDARSFTVFSDAQIIAEVPADAVDGPITVGGPNGSVSSSQSFDVLASSPLPSVSGFNPLQGQAGSQVNLTLQNLGDIAPLAQGSNGPFVFNIRSGKEIKGLVTVENGPPGDQVKVSLVIQTTPAGLPPLAAAGITTSLKPSTFPAGTGGANLDIKTSLTTPPFENLVFRVDAVSTKFANVTYKPVVIVINDRAPIALDPRPFELKAAQGSEAVYTINVDRNKEAKGLPVTFSTDPNALPSGSMIKFDPPSTNGDSALLRIAIPATAAKSTYKFKVMGDSTFNGGKVAVEPGDARLKVAEIQITLEPPVDPVKVRAVEQGSATVGVKRAAGGMPASGVPVTVRITNRDELKKNGFTLLPETGELTVTGDTAIFDFQIDEKMPPENPNQEVQLEALIQDTIKTSASFFLRVEGGATIEVNDSPLDVPVGGGSNMTGFTVQRSQGFHDTFTLDAKVNLPEDLKQFSHLVSVAIDPTTITDGVQGGTVTVTLLAGFPAGESFLIQIEAPGNENVLPGTLAITSVPARNQAPPRGGRSPV